MSMPAIPPATHRPNMQQTTIDLLESIALEEIAISHLLNAEGEKTQAIVKQFATNCINDVQMEHGCRSTQDMIHTLIMKEWLLYIKLRAVMDLRQQEPVQPPATPLPQPCSCCAMPQPSACTQPPAVAIDPMQLELSQMQPAPCASSLVAVCHAYMPDASTTSTTEIAPCCDNCIHRHICADHRQRIEG